MCIYIYIHTYNRLTLCVPIRRPKARRLSASISGGGDELLLLLLLHIIIIIVIIITIIARRLKRLLLGGGGPPEASPRLGPAHNSCTTRYDSAVRVQFGTIRAQFVYILTICVRTIRRPQRGGSSASFRGAGGLSEKPRPASPRGGPARPRGHRI